MTHYEVNTINTTTKTETLYEAEQVMALLEAMGKKYIEIDEVIETETYTYIQSVKIISK